MGPPFLELDEETQEPVIELKQTLILYLDHPPSPREAEAVYRTWMDVCGERVRFYRSTVANSSLRVWDAGAQRRFETEELQRLRQREHWGYVFWDGRPVDSWLFMFHGYRPSSEPGRASFFRFEFDWKVDPSLVLRLAIEALNTVDFVWGFAGYVLQGDQSDKHFDRMYALAQRYWGVEAHSLDVTVQHALTGYKCVNWLTLIGDELRRQHPEAVERASAEATHSIRGTAGVLLQAGNSAQLGDRNRAEHLSVHTAIARYLRPLQMSEHAPFGGSRWDEVNTMDYIHRFTSGGWSVY